MENDARQQGSPEAELRARAENVLLSGLSSGSLQADIASLEHSEDGLRAEADEVLNQSASSGKLQEVVASLDSAQQQPTGEQPLSPAKEARGPSSPIGASPAVCGGASPGAASQDPASPSSPPSGGPPISPARRPLGQLTSPKSTEDWKAGLQAQIHGRIRQTMKEKTGPSFQERSEQAASKFRKEAKMIEEKQKSHIMEALERAKAKPTNSPVRHKSLAPPSFEDRAKEHNQTIQENRKNFIKVSVERTKKLKAREPLFRVSEVEAAFEMQRQRQQEKRRQLTEDEEQRWQHIAELQQRAANRPMLLEDYERPVHVKSVPDLRMIPEIEKDTPLQRKVKMAVTRKQFKESQWGQEVVSIRQRQDSRPPLSEIKYPPKVIVEPKLPPRILQPIDARMDEEMLKPAYQTCAWNATVQEMRQRQRDRPPLSEQNNSVHA